MAEKKKPRSKRMKPCPFCGAKAKLKVWPAMEFCAAAYQVQCSAFSCGGTVWHDRQKSVAIETWNRRDG